MSPKKPYFESSPYVLDQPLGYDDPSKASISPGGLRLDKAVRIGNRLVLDFEKHACLPCNVVGLDQDCKYYIPHELAEKGITASQWHEWCRDLDKVQRKSPSIYGCVCLFCFPAGLVQSILCAALCPISAHHCLDWLPCCYGDWHYGIARWQSKVNETLLAKSMMCKLKTYKPHNRAPNSLMKRDRIVGKDENYEMAMLEIALTPDEVNKMKMESWDNGVGDGCTSGRGRQL